MSFGFSVGDFLATGKLAADIVSCLKDSGGSREEYQGLVRELDCLQSALVHLDKLTGAGESSHTLDSIKYAALSCRRPLEDFLARIRKYDNSLAVHAKPSAIKGAINKIRFPLSHKDEIQKLQAYLGVHIGSVNILLAEHGLERMKLAADRSEMGQFQIKERLENTTGLLGHIQTSVASQARAVHRSMAMVERVYKILRGELKASLASFEGTVAKVW